MVEMLGEQVQVEEKLFKKALFYEAIGKSILAFPSSTYFL